MDGRSPEYWRAMTRHLEALKAHMATLDPDDEQDIPKILAAGDAVIAAVDDVLEQLPLVTETMTRGGLRICPGNARTAPAVTRATWRK